MNRIKRFSIGFQGGYTSKSIDLSKLYFGDEFYNGQFIPGTGSESLNNKECSILQLIPGLAGHMHQVKILAMLLVSVLTT